ncbi:LTA synthase family protein [Pedobacter sp. L105]|uniref:LTA synthase family protein n=1 Tax=Pedobacter sp. L105 TaxID=1641871 RepID=UPI00131B563F|nr:LTA synthase family protein [Pedobacter sp. L105]
MLRILIFFVRFFIFWLLFFLLDRLLFLSVFLRSLPENKFQETTAAFYHGLRLDLAMSAYLIIVPLIYFTYTDLRSEHQPNFQWLKVYNKVLVILFSLIGIINFNIYREWGSKINAKAVDFAVTAPNEAIASSASSPIVFSLALLAVLIACGLLLNNYIIKTNTVAQRTPLWAKISNSLFMAALTFLLIRGGWGVAPNNQSMAYYSEDQLLNNAAVNTEWNFISSLLKSYKSNKNLYQFYPEIEAVRQVNQLYAAKKDSTIHILNTQKPNVVVIIMESFTADLTKTLGHETGITPGFDTLARHGVLFSQIYATGNRTDKGIIGTLAGYPSLAAENMVQWPEKMEKIPALSQTFLKQGYHTSFFYGGQSEFDNFKAFILSHGYQSLTDKKNFKARDMNSKWGAYDGVVFNRQLHDLNQSRQPFFSTHMTLTNHEPFEVPGAYKFGKADNTQKFKSTAFYTDSCLNDFLTRAKKQPWYKNTLFVIVADHGHILPKGREEIYIPQRYHIPLLFFGEVIKPAYRGKIFKQVGSQIDIASTLLHQLDMNAKAFVWSKNMLSPATKSFAYFSWDNGIGFIDNKQCVTFDNVGRMCLYNNHPGDAENTRQLLKQEKSYLQIAYHQFSAL